MLNQLAEQGQISASCLDTTDQLPKTKAAKLKTEAILSAAPTQKQKMNLLRQSLPSSAEIQRAARVTPGA
jgi:hypothetical protein